jgi:hypothetical protein
MQKRIVRGLAWGSVATVTMAVAALLQMGVGAWPLERPLGVYVARALTPGAGTIWWFVLGALGQLAFGAICGALLSALVERVTVSSALALGLLRWLTTQLLVLPLAGFPPFGLITSPPLALATAFPHLAFAVSLGWLLSHEDDVDFLRGPLWPARVRSRYRKR